MRALIILVLLIIYSCSKSENMIIFSDKNKSIYLSNKLIGKRMRISEIVLRNGYPEYNHMCEECEISLLINKTQYNINELSLRKGKKYRISVIYLGVEYFIEVGNVPKLVISRK